MKYKTFLIIFAILVVALVGMGCISAQDNETSTLKALNTNDTSLNVENGDEIGITNIVNASENDNQPLKSSSGENDDSWSVAERTFKIGKYKVVLSQAQMENWVDARNLDENAKYGLYPDDTEFVGGLTAYEYLGIGGTLKKYTGKTIKQKVGVGFKGYKNLVIKMPKKIKSYKKADKWADKYIKKVKKIRGKVGYINIYKKKGRYFLDWNKPMFKKFKTVKAKVYIVLNYGICRYSARNGAYNMFLTTNYQLNDHTFLGTYLENHYRESKSLMGLKK